MKSSIPKVSWLILSGLVGATLVYLLKPASVSSPYPWEANYAVKYHVGNTWACKGVARTAIRSDDGKYRQKAGVFAEASTKEVESLSIKIDGSNLYLTTKTDVDVGTISDRPMKILQDDQDIYVAIDRNTEVGSIPIDLFLLNKKNGIALWSKTLNNILTIVNPVGEQYYLVCH